jgi:uncharacterized protein
MFEVRKRMRFGFGALLWLSFALLVSCLCLGAALKRTQNRIFKQEFTPLTVHPSKTVHRPTDALQPSESLPADADGDGFPDGAELRTFMDRENFRQAFTGIAEMQFYRLSDHWNSEQRDCAGLVRFAWREALRRHDRSWFQKMGPGYDAIAPSSGLNTNPLGEKLFRTNFGAFKQNDISEGRFSEFADARTLKNFNCAFISRDRQLAQRGDLLFYYQPWIQKFPYHVMIFLGESRVGGGASRDWVVYHTGASATDQGTVKKVELTVLDHHPNRRWRPVEDNPNFLGFYRLKILD